MIFGIQESEESRASSNSKQLEKMKFILFFPEPGKIFPTEIKNVSTVIIQKALEYIFL